MRSYTNMHWSVSLTFLSITDKVEKGERKKQQHESNYKKICTRIVRWNLCVNYYITFTNYHILYARLY